MQCPLYIELIRWMIAISHHRFYSFIASDHHQFPCAADVHLEFAYSWFISGLILRYRTVFTPVRKRECPISLTTTVIPMTNGVKSCLQIKTATLSFLLTPYIRHLGESIYTIDRKIKLLLTNFFTNLV